MTRPALPDQRKELFQKEKGVGKVEGIKRPKQVNKDKARKQIITEVGILDDISRLSKNNFSGVVRDKSQPAEALGMKGRRGESNKHWEARHSQWV